MRLAPVQHVAAFVILSLVGTAALAGQDPQPDPKAALREAWSRLMGVKPADPEDGVEPLEHAAALGDLSAKFHLAYLYWNSRASPELDEQKKLANERKARALFLEVAATGDPYAAAELGTSFAQGIGGAKDPAEARKWYEAGARGGLAEPAGSLAWMFEHGTGVRPDLAEAYKWLDIGSGLFAKEPLVPAQMAGKREELARRMTAKQIADANARVRAWRVSMKPFDACYAQGERIRLDVAAVDDVDPERDFTAWIADVTRQLKQKLRRPPCSAIEGRTRLTAVVWPNGRVEHVDNLSSWGLPYFDDAVVAAMNQLEPAPLPRHERGFLGVTLRVGAYYNETPLPPASR